MGERPRRRPGGTGTRTPAPRRARDTEILDAAREILRERDYAEIRVDDVARRAGLAKATLYRYFPSKDRLYAVVLRRWAERHRTPPPSPPAPPGPPRARARVDAVITAYERDPRILRLEIVLAATTDPEVRAELSATAAATHQLLAGDFAAPGPHDRPPVSPHDAAIMLRAIISPALTRAAFHGAPFADARHRAARFLDLFEPPDPSGARPRPLPRPFADPPRVEPPPGPQRRDRIVRTTLEALKAHPHEDVHVSDIAQHAGIALGTLYRAFPSKEYLYAVAVHEWFSTSGFVLPFPGHTPHERLRARATAAIDAFEAHPQILRLNHTLYNAADPAVRAVITQIAATAWTHLSRDFHALGVAHPDEASTMLWALLDSLTRAALVHDTSFPETHRLAAELITLLTRPT